MKDYAIFLCDPQWNIQKPLHLPADQPLAAGASLLDWLADPAVLTDPALFDGQDRRFVVLPLRDGQSVPALLSAYPSHRLAVLARVENEADFVDFGRMYERCASWAGEAFQEYHDEYTDIQRMNNQLVNSQRALVKSNMQYRQALAEVRDANNLISLLEQDDLTTLLCAAALQRRAREAMAAAPTEAFELLVVDLKPFKLVNEIFGRPAGDRLLQDYALLLAGLDASGQGVFARASGNTFLVFTPAALRFDRVVLEQTRVFLAHYPLPVRLHCRIGGCIAAADVTPEEMCDRARLATDTLHSTSGSDIAFYNETLHHELLLQHKILDSIQDAMQRQQLQLYLQPKVQLASGRVAGFEALVRWFHPEMGCIPPMQFIPLLEQTGSIYAVDQYVWEQACKILQQRRALGLPDLPISVNVARSDFYQPDLLDVLQGLLRKYSLPPHLLRLEILERAYAKDSAQLSEVLTRLREHGFPIEMDDFGVGESSLAMLTELPVDTIKLDRQFLLSTLKNPRHAAVIRCIIQLAHALDIGVLAEGVETPDQARMLRDLGCFYAQGYLYSRPESAEIFLQ